MRIFKVSALCHRHTYVQQCNPFITVISILDDILQQVYEVGFGGKKFVSGFSNATRRHNVMGKRKDTTKSSTWNKTDNIFTIIPLISTTIQRHYFMWQLTSLLHSVPRGNSAELGAIRICREAGFMRLVQGSAVSTVFGFYWPQEGSGNVFLRLAKSNKHIVHCQSKFCTLGELTGCD